MIWKKGSKLNSDFAKREISKHSEVGPPVIAEVTPEGSIGREIALARL
jgi:hypothetical protein